MSAGATRVRVAYDFHGIGVEVCAQDAAVLAAMDLRLRDFRREPGLAALRIEFVADRRDAHADSELCAQPGRPVYDTPYGSLHYVAERDLLHGTLGRVHLHCEPASGLALIRSSQFSGRELYFATHPLATVSLMELLERHGLFSLHAACLATSEGRGVLLSGTSGAGKSTLSLALVRAGMSFLSDDVVFLVHTAATAKISVLGFADTVGLTPFASERFEELRGRLSEPPADGFPKRLGRIEDLFGVSALRDCAPHALVFTEVVHDQSSAIAPLDPREALLRLVPDVLATQAASTQAHLGAIAALLDQVCCYQLRSGADLEHAAELVRAIV
jgi:hypothetical protein